ncbi:MAG: hypothetical protein HRU41_03525 [Saprospiraceae bacterium]|nr:hypothetical protein [Saprospiraceae bacterium]
MITRRVVFLWLVLVMAIPLQAQRDEIPAKISWGEELREPAKTFIAKTVSAGPWGFNVLRLRQGNVMNGDQVFLERYDDRLRLKKSQKIDLRYRNKKRAFEDVVKIGGQLYLFTSFNNQVKKKNYLFYQKVSHRLMPSRDIVKIGEIDTRSKYREGDFDLVLSRDSSKVLIYNQLPYQKNEPERFTLRVFDDQLNEEWTRDITLPYNDDVFEIEEYRVDKEGNVYLLGVIYQERNRIQRRGQPTYGYTVLAYLNGGTEKQEYRIDLGDKFITDLTFRVGNDGNLVCSGFYSDRGTVSIKGTYFLRMNAKAKEIYQVNFKAFDLDFLTLNMTRGQRKRAERNEKNGNEDRAPELYRFSLDELIMRTDGGAVLVAEQYYVYEQSFFSYWDRSTRVNYFYHYNDILVINIKPTGEIEWASRIPKRQETVNDGGYYSSYAMATVRDRFYFIFNDNPRNFDGRAQSGNRRVRENYNGRYTVVSLAEVKIDGSVRMMPLFTNRDADVITRPKICRQSGSKHMLVYGERGRNFRFADLAFE